MKDPELVHILIFIPDVISSSKEIFYYVDKKKSKITPVVGKIRSYLEKGLI